MKSMSVFTESDVKRIMRAATWRPAFPSSSESGPVKPHAKIFQHTLELVSGGLILEHHAKSLVEKAIFSDEDSSKLSMTDGQSFVHMLTFVSRPDHTP